MKTYVKTPKSNDSRFGKNEIIRFRFVQALLDFGVILGRMFNVANVEMLPISNWYWLLATLPHFHILPLLPTLHFTFYTLKVVEIDFPFVPSELTGRTATVSFFPARRCDCEILGPHETLTNQGIARSVPAEVVATGLKERLCRIIS